MPYFLAVGKMNSVLPLNQKTYIFTVQTEFYNAVHLGKWFHISVLFDFIMQEPLRRRFNAKVNF